MTKLDSAVSLSPHFPDAAHFLQFSKQIETPRSMNDLISFTQIRVRAKIDKMKDDLNWQEYLNDIVQNETQEPPRKRNVELASRSTPFRLSLPSSAAESKVLLKNNRTPAKGQPQQRNHTQREWIESSDKLETVHKSLQQDIPSMPSKMPTSRQPVKSPCIVKALPPRFTKPSDLCITYKENYHTLARTLASKDDIEKLSNTLPSKEDIQRLARILISKEIIRHHTNKRLPSSGLRLSKSQFQKGKEKSTSDISRKPILVKPKPNEKHYTGTARQTPQKQNKLKCVKFANKIEDTDSKLGNEAILQNETEQTSDVTRHQNTERAIFEQFIELKKIRLELEKMQEQETNIQRKWNRICGSQPTTTPVAMTAAVVMHKPFTHVHFRSKDGNSQTQDFLPRNSSTNRIDKLERIADSIFDDAVRDVAQELKQISEDCVNRLYEEEFNLSSPSISRGFV